jgi:hypothetical protein
MQPRGSESPFHGAQVLVHVQPALQAPAVEVTVWGYRENQTPLRAKDAVQPLDLASIVNSGQWNKETIECSFPGATITTQLLRGRRGNLNKASKIAHGIVPVSSSSFFLKEVHWDVAQHRPSMPRLVKRFVDDLRGLGCFLGLLDGPSMSAGPESPVLTRRLLRLNRWHSDAKNLNLIEDDLVLLEKAHVVNWARVRDSGSRIPAKLRRLNDVTSFHSIGNVCWLCVPCHSLFDAHGGERIPKALVRESQQRAWRHPVAAQALLKFISDTLDAHDNGRRDLVDGRNLAIAARLLALYHKKILPITLNSRNPKLPVHVINEDGGIDSGFHGPIQSPYPE